MSYLNFAMKEKRRGRKTQTRTVEVDCSFPYCSRYFPTVPCCFERPTYAIIFADGKRGKPETTNNKTREDYELLRHYRNQLGKAAR